MRRCRLTGADISLLLAILLAPGRELGAPESVIARGLVPVGPGLLTFAVATGEGNDPFLEAG